MKKLIVAAFFCTLMLGMMTSLSVTGTMGTASAAVRQLDSCIDQGLTCILNGTSCCGTLKCKGKFPNTTCQ